MKLLYNICCLLALAFIVSCGGQEENKVKVVQVDSLKNPLADANKELVKEEERQINDFLSRYNWDMQQTGTGLRYLIYKKGTGDQAQSGKYARINFEVKLITGDLCYTSKDDGAKEFLIGKSTEISGLEEGILLLHVGDKAKFIIPSHLAFGLLGDEDKIPKRATLVYDVELLEIK